MKKLKKLKQKEIIEIIECLLIAPIDYYDNTYYEDRLSDYRDKQGEQMEFRNSIIDKLKKGVYYE